MTTFALAAFVQRSCEDDQIGNDDAPADPALEARQSVSGATFQLHRTLHHADATFNPIAEALSLDGLEVVKRIRASSNVPVIMLTAKGDETDRVVGLELGADDYLPKPFNPRELVARLKAVLRRSRPGAVAEKLQVGAIAVDVTSREARVEGQAVELTGIEFDILVALMRRAGRVVPRDALLSEAGRGDVVVGERTVDVHISHLRAKLGEPSPIKTVRGVGYVFAKEGA